MRSKYIRLSMACHKMVSTRSLDPQKHKWLRKLASQALRLAERGQIQ